MSLADINSDRDKLAVLSMPARESMKTILQPNEQVLWSGKPLPRAAWCESMPGNIKSRRACALLYAITAALASYLFLFLSAALLGYIFDRLSGNGNWWNLVTLPIVAGLLLCDAFFLLLVIFPWISIWQARHRSYVLTNRKAITISEFPRDIKLKWMDLGDVEAPRVTRKRKDGLGDIIFSGTMTRSTTGDLGMKVYTSFDTGFTACPEAEQVAVIFSKARQQRLGDREREDIEEMQRDYQGWLRRKGRL